ncbi:methyltransferase domain-containing protein [Terrabacter sp. MAHUQ-38]|jgi:ubiquinone/menaquinone biosynthesis C-methylase UbiE|uniref:methyltransferase domain-containing protein n=1 Tax=unclassified Terrabacter TaxID=2630222 RepID=UPI00165DAF77|nr:methyltransferase domain-containing protein [Terrabacter sp. MAHUQ-38]MBC9821433.1 methyltransferase domain-containing protein [Terrabacter sp. MAHUQ-38]
MTDVYLHGHHSSVLASHGVRTAADSAAYLLPHLRDGLHVLDVGCGPGTITLDLAEAVGPTGHVIGIENVTGPLAEAGRNAAARGDARTRFELADVMALPYAAASFDVVHAHQVLQHLTDPVGALREMARVTRPGGRVAVRDVDYASMVWHPASAGMTRWLEVYRRLARLNHAEPDAGRHLVAWAHAAGLARLTPSASLWTYATPEQCAWWGGVWARRTLQSTFATQAVERGLLTEDELTEVSEAWRAWSVHRDAWFAMTHAEILATV